VEGYRLALLRSMSAEKRRVAAKIVHLVDGENESARGCKNKRLEYMEQTTFRGGDRLKGFESVDSKLCR
jgi:hypothetical protein